ncbi:DUF6158 family protein [Epidermidibacterium keratini]|uniref:DUF6158 family protein n=1 Tax=Epidermidibacterium keratini TaxID=1891644 RepID=UPI0018658E34|nr:DUF6158 family protein [Epidermidibacterium keratini]
MSNDQHPLGRPVSELSDEELETQGKNAHDTRNWVFLHGTAEQFATHTERMLALEQEYLRRHPKRTWQGVESSSDAGEEVEQVPDPVRAVLRAVADTADGRMNRLEVHQLARRFGVPRPLLAGLYTGDDPLLATDRQDRVITDAGRAYLR